MMKVLIESGNLCRILQDQVTLWPTWRSKHAEASFTHCPTLIKGDVVMVIQDLETSNVQPSMFPRIQVLTGKGTGWITAFAVLEQG